MERHTLPQVVEFGHGHTVKVINDGSTTRIIATPNAKWAPKYKHMHDLPFVSREANPSRPAEIWWSFPPAANEAEAEQRGQYFWDEFVRFTRGTKRRRGDDAERLLHYALPAMLYSAAHNGVEASIFLRRLSTALVEHLRVGVEP